MQPFSRPHEREPIQKSSAIPLSPSTVEHWMTFKNATTDSVMSYEESIQCPSYWTPDHWMNALSPIPAISYDESSTVQAWTLDAAE